MKEIPLTQGKVAIVDDEDYDFLMQWKWCALRRKRKTMPDVFYAVRGPRLSDGENFHGPLIAMHRVILNAPDEMEVDHGDHDGLNNTRANIRIVTPLQNMQNKRFADRPLPRGVVLMRKTGKYRVQIRANGRRIYKDGFIDPVEAGVAYDEMSRQYHGEFGIRNSASAVQA